MCVCLRKRGHFQVGIDTAYDYNDEGGVGSGIRAAGKSGPAVFLETKIPCSTYKRAKAAIASNLQQLGVGSVDLTLIHTPCRFVCRVDPACRAVSCRVVPCRGTLVVCTRAYISLSLSCRPPLVQALKALPSHQTRNVTKRAKFLASEFSSLFFSPLPCIN